MADSRRDKGYLGIDSSVLIAYLVPDHPDHEATRSLTRKRHAVNPTVLHETYHTSVFKLRRKPRDTVRTLVAYMNMALCLPLNSVTAEVGLKLALKHPLSGRDALILSSYLLSKHIKTFVTLDKSLLSLRSVELGKKTLKVTSPAI